MLAINLISLISLNAACQKQKMSNFNIVLLMYVQLAVQSMSTTFGGGIFMIERVKRKRKAYCKKKIDQD